LLLALMLFGLARVARPFLRVQPVDLGRLFLFAVLSYIVIDQGGVLMQEVEAWRSEAGSYLYTQVAEGETVSLDIPGTPASADEPLYAPADLDGQAPLRGWEAVASSYFLVRDAGELHAGVPPRDFRLAYCLYDPQEPIDSQAEENAAGCSPRQAWDEWETITLTQPITQVWGVPLPGSVALDIPLVQEHPANRQLAIRQAQAGVARLAMGPVVALFPMVEANIALMLALAASFIYLSLPIVLLFGFFMVTEALATRLLLQLLNVILRTLILNGLAALFLMLLMGVSLNGSLTAYLGLVGAGLIGGVFLMRLAAGTMKESFSQALGAVGGVWLGAAAATMGQGAVRPARAALGLAKLGATAAVLGAAGGRSLDLAEAGLHSARSGARDLQQTSPATLGPLQRTAGRLPAPLARLARAELAPPRSGDEPEPVRAAVPLPGTLLAPANGAGTRETRARPGSTVAPSELSLSDRRFEPEREREPATGPIPARRERAIEGWVEHSYRARQQGQGQPQARGLGRSLLGEALADEAEQALDRHQPAETKVVFAVARQVQAERGQANPVIGPDGRLAADAVEAVRDRLEPQAARAFADRPGQRGLRVLSAVAWQHDQTASPADFRRAGAAAQDRPGERAPGRSVPRALGLDPVAAGAHFAGLNRFARLSEQAGLSPDQRQALLAEVRQGDPISARLRDEIEVALRRQQGAGSGLGLKVDDVIASAAALPDTLTGPRHIQVQPGRVTEATPLTGTSATSMKPTPDNPLAPSRPDQKTGTRT
jgi:hypothetical protein